jgi:putative flippase GtrA
MILKIFEKRIFRYILSGLISFAVENITFIILYYPLHLEVKAANIISICVALTSNFFVSKFYVFQDKKTTFRATKQFLKYLALVFVNVTVSTITVSKLVHNGVPGFVAKPVVTVFIAGWTYLIYRSIIFKDIMEAK